MRLAEGLGGFGKQLMSLGFKLLNIEDVLLLQICPGDGVSLSLGLALLLLVGILCVGPYQSVVLLVQLGLA